MYKRVYRILFPFIAILFITACSSNQNKNEIHKKLAKQLFTEGYTGHLENIDRFIGDSMVSSYPVFSKIFHKEALRGKKAYLDFLEGFSKRWSDQKIIFRDVVAGDNKVMLMWSFSATRTAYDEARDSLAGKNLNWGGITLIRFNDDDEIIAEIGEESSPGPFARTNTGK